MTKPKATAPYQPDDRGRAMLTDREGTTCLAVVTLDRVTPLAGGRTWRIGGTRAGNPRPEPAWDRPRVEWVVDATGRDIHRYVEPAPASPASRAPDASRYLLTAREPPVGPWRSPATLEWKRSDVGVQLVKCSTHPRQRDPGYPRARPSSADARGWVA